VLEADGFQPHCEFRRFCAAHKLAFSLQSSPAPHDKKYDDPKAWEHFEADARGALAEGKHFLLSSEEFDKPDVDILKLASSLAGFELRVLVAHRRFDSWLRSLHLELNQHPLVGEKNISNVAEQYTALADWLTEKTIVQLRQCTRLMSFSATDTWVM